MPGPLHGMKVLELGTLIAAPFASRMLAEFGADVVKVEDQLNLALDESLGPIAR